MARVDFKEIEKKLSSTKARPTLSVLRASYGIIAFVMIYWDIYAMKSIFIWWNMRRVTSKKLHFSFYL